MKECETGRSSGHNEGGGLGVSGMMRRVLLLGAIIPMAGCVQVSAPDKPIVIDLNINIRQEVVYRLDSKAQELIQQQTDIF